MARSIPLTASLEDYLEAIFHLENKDKVARGKDIAEALGVAQPSVTGAMRSLAGKGLVNYEPYGLVTLTEAGRREAGRIAEKHRIIESFFVQVLGVDIETAQRAACKAEHALGPAVCERLLAFTNFIEKSKQDGRDIAGQFEAFCE
ncbi:MAG: metal-dependent transcriptional regulator [Sedimentisphaerales bacterium]|nr:metal-dependent transcriptional regulator [Sedimentisphaerales bacterium]